MIVSRPTSASANQKPVGSSGAEVKPPDFEIGETVLWKGSDEDLPAGIQGRVEVVHDDGDVEVRDDEEEGGSQGLRVAQRDEKESERKLS